MTAYVRQYHNNKMTKVSVGKLTLWFSYETCVAFDNGHGIVVCENIWSSTTGKHLNSINSDKSERIPRAEFQKQLAAAMP